MTDDERRAKVIDTVQMFMRTDRFHRAAVEAQVPKLGVHRSQHIILMYLARAETPPTQCELAKIFEISAAAVTVTLQKLEKAGLVERSPQEGDGRANVIRVTEKGREMVRRTREMFEEVDTAMCEGITDEELDILLRCMTRMQQNLRECSPGTDLECRKLHPRPL